MDSHPFMRSRPVLQRPRLATAQVLYYMPAHPALLQSFTWQTQDQAPRFPRIMRFLDFWRREIDAAIHSVQVSAAGMAGDAKGWRFADGEWSLH